MTMKMGLWALGLFTIGSAIIVSCGGSSDSDGGTAGTGGTSPSSGSGGSSGSATAGTPATTGGTTATAGTTSSGGTPSDSGGAAPSGGGEGPTFPGSGGDGPSFPGAGGDGPSFPGAGGDGPTSMCPATQPADGDACTLQGFVNCDYAEVRCNCRRMGGGQGQQGTRAWDCGAAEPGAGGAGGAGPGFGTAECPANAADDDVCTGTGLCEGQSCFCVNGSVTCFG